MDSSDKKQFWLAINIVMELTNKPPLTKEAIMSWWGLLSKYEFSTVHAALNKWVDNSSKPPTPNDIIGLCKSTTPVYQALPAPEKANKADVAKLSAVMAAYWQPQKNHRAWLDRILNNPHKFPRSSVEAAEKVKYAK